MRAPSASRDEIHLLQGDRRSFWSPHCRTAYILSTEELPFLIAARGFFGIERLEDLSEFCPEPSPQNQIKDVEWPWSGLLRAMLKMFTTLVRFAELE